MPGAKGHSLRAGHSLREGLAVVPGRTKRSLADMFPDMSAPGLRFRRVAIVLFVFCGAIPPAGAFGQVITEFPVPTAKSYPDHIAAGPDGALWFTERDAGKIGRITTAGVITEFAIPTAKSNPDGMAAGSDGALWFPEEGSGKIGRITTAGVATEFTLPPFGTLIDVPIGMAAGPDGAL